VRKQDIWHWLRIMFYVLLVYIDIWGYAVGGFVHYEDGFHGKKLVGTGS